MISIDGAVSALKKAFPNAKPRYVFEFDDSRWLVAAPESDEDYNTPFYLVDKGNGGVKQANPFEEIDRFNAAMQRGPVKAVSKGKME